ncbi:hypothetical protein OS493_002517 [Desmophyllum pertusum]|uniref:Uncharacterized protein n=1 Tax=Desmophyllum pertusum TaxID=174260 RepID=A0A9W9YVV0_9CNID|nr:hypothetical protein OS493_002517 [Desmophyllum pertusum]
MPFHYSKFAVEKSKPRSTSPVLVAVLPQAEMQYFDVEAKTWKPLTSTTLQPIEAYRFYCGISVGRNLFVAGQDNANSNMFIAMTQKVMCGRHAHVHTRVV